MSDSTIFRFKFSNEFISELQSFAKLYQYTDRHIYKEQWTNWISANDEIIDKECRRLKSIGYDGNILDKMYKSGRYYFRNKSTETKEPKQRRKYISIDCQIIENMDLYIKEHAYHENTIIKPAILYSQFCEAHKIMIPEEIERLKELELSNDDITHKFKKTFKNRYFIYQQQNGDYIKEFDKNERNDDLKTRED